VGGPEGQGFHSSLMSSTSNVRVALPGMTPGCPLLPYAKSGEQMSRALWPTDIWRGKEWQSVIIAFMA